MRLMRWSSIALVRVTLGGERIKFIPIGWSQPGRKTSDKVLAKRNSPRQGQVFGVVDGDRLPAHVGFPGVTAAFTPAAGLLFAAKGTADFGAAGADVDVGDAAIAAAAGQELLGFAEVVRENGRAESLRHFVVIGDGFVQRAIRNEVKDRSESFLMDYFEIVPGLDQAGAHITAAGKFRAA